MEYGLARVLGGGGGVQATTKDAINVMNTLKLNSLVIKIRPLIYAMSTYLK